MARFKSRSVKRIIPRIIKCEYGTFIVTFKDNRYGTYLDDYHNTVCKTHKATILYRVKLNKGNGCIQL